MPADDVGGAMEVSSEEQLSIDSVKRRESCELIKLIRKLRWIGMEQEAEVVARALVGRAATDSLLAGPSDTD
jgi:hypothetical protein